MTAKEIISQQLGIPPTKIRTRKGRGTARSWLHIYTPVEVSPSDRKKIESILIEKDLCGTYQSDYLPGEDTREACVNWSLMSHYFY